MYESEAHDALMWFSVQWLSRLPKDVKEQKLQEVMDLMADGIIKPPPARKPFSLFSLSLAAHQCLLSCRLLSNMQAETVRFSSTGKRASDGHACWLVQVQSIPSMT